MYSLLGVSLYLLPCLCVLMLFKSLVEIEVKIESRLHYIDTLYDDDCTKICFILKNFGGIKYLKFTEGVKNKMESI